LHTVYDPNAEVPVYFEMTHAKVNDRKTLATLPVLSSVIYVVDQAYNDYGWYYTLDQMGSTFVGRMKTNARYEAPCEVEIYCDKQGIDFLKKELFKLENFGDHFHLMSPSWGRDDLSKKIFR
jgi:hypothetical protein